MDSISYIDESEREQIVISASHGGVASARYALDHPPFLTIFNDAGVGKDGAGIAALAILEEAGLAAAAIYHTSGRIGDVADMWVYGIVGHVNRRALRLGVDKGLTLQEAIRKL
ncbi:MAG: hypothetical protein QNJ45_04885 [Ardenticatenaceae bacterium]|nr:hypothetical protein [Ardenticatenaceae bacterium]